MPRGQRAHQGPRHQHQVSISPCWEQQNPPPGHVELALADRLSHPRAGHSTHPPRVPRPVSQPHPLFSSKIVTEAQGGRRQRYAGLSLTDPPHPWPGPKPGRDAGKCRLLCGHMANANTHTHTTIQRHSCATPHAQLLAHQPMFPLSWVPRKQGHTSCRSL